jgi:hypothetical protein
VEKRGDHMVVEVETLKALEVLKARVKGQEVIEPEQEVEEEPSSQKEKPCQHHIGNRRDKKGTDVFPREDEDVFHKDNCCSLSGSFSSDSLEM